MSLYAIGDLHLSLGTNKPMDDFGGVWIDYFEKIKTGLSVLNDDDVCVLCGDTSWGMSLEESLEDFRFIDSFPGKKLLIKGNHDYWWNTAKKMKSFFIKNDIKSIDIIHNNSFLYGETAICGTRGWMLEEGVAEAEHHLKITAREAIRLRASLVDAEAKEPKQKLCFFHYPPRFRDIVCDDIVNVMKEFNVCNCWYGHLHGMAHTMATRGEIDGIFYSMVSADYLDFKPKLILEKFAITEHF